MLAAATAAAARVVPVFVVDPALLARHAAARLRLAWYRASLVRLDGELREAGGALLVVRGDPVERLAELAGQLEAAAVYATRDEDPLAVERDAAVARRLELRLVDDQRLLPPGALRSSSGSSYRIFTPFRRALEERLAAEPWLLEEALPGPGRLARADELPAGDGPDAFPAPGMLPEMPVAGSAAAGTQLAVFVNDRLGGYAEARNRPGEAATSRLSPYLRVGSLSVRAAWRAAAAAGPDGAAWRRELAWRELFADRLAAGSLDDADDPVLTWSDGERADQAFARWCAGRTGVPFVDAGMRELAATGWMHNRARMVAASFLVKHLGIDWRRGEAHFMTRLLDGDLAQNRGNWRWVAGLGAGSAPWFRVLNPVVQARRFDPAGDYLRRWLPELVELDGRELHEPWTVPTSRRGGYPDPVADPDAKRAADLLRRMRGRRGAG